MGLQSPSSRSRNETPTSREAFAADERNYASQKPLRLRDRKRRASRVSLRAEPSDYGVPSVVADEVRGAAGRALSPREIPLLRTPLSGLLPTCSSLPVVSGVLWPKWRN